MTYNLKISTFRPLDLTLSADNDHNFNLIWQYGIDCNDSDCIDEIDSIQCIEIDNQTFYCYRDVDGLYYCRTREGMFNSMDFLSVISIIVDYLI